MSSNIFVTAGCTAESKMLITVMKMLQDVLISGVLHWTMPHATFLQQHDKMARLELCKKFENYPRSFIELKKMLGMGHSLFLTFLRSLGGSFRALMISDEALGTTDTLACLFWIVNWTVIRSPFQSCVALAMSSPTFLGDWNVYNELIMNMTINKLMSQ